MVLEGYRERLAPRIARLARPWLGWRPASLSALALGLTATAGVVALLVRYSTPLLFLLVAGLLFSGGVFDVLDGEVARQTGRSSRRGDLLDHVFDRYGDVAVVLGLAASGYAMPVLALLALVSLLLASYMGTQAQAVGVGRIYRGLLGRADRVVLLTVAAFLEFLFVVPWPWPPVVPLARFSFAHLSWTVFDLVFAWFVLAGNWTAVSRARSAWRALPAADGPPPPRT